MRLSPRILIPLLGIAVVWALLLGAAQIRLNHDRDWCGGPRLIGQKPPASQIDRTCIARREAARWGPYHLFGSNNPYAGGAPD